MRSCRGERPTWRGDNRTAVLYGDNKTFTHPHYPLALTWQWEILELNGGHGKCIDLNGGFPLPCLSNGGKLFSSTDLILFGRLLDKIANDKGSCTIATLHWKLKSTNVS